MSNQKIVPIEKLVISTENARFSPIKKEKIKSEYEAAIELIDKNVEKMYNLIVSISDNYESHPFILLEDNDVFVVADGNRRLTAIKLLKKIIILPNDIRYKKINEYLSYNSFDKNEVHCDCYSLEEKEKLDRRLDKIHTTGDDTIYSWIPIHNMVKIIKNILE